MPHQPQNNDSLILRSYLLGDLSPSEQDHVEDLFAADVDYFALYQDVERDVLREYAANAMSSADASLFRANYLITSKRRERLTIFQALIDTEAQGSEEMPRSAYILRCVAALCPILIAVAVCRSPWPTSDHELTAISHQSSRPMVPPGQALYSAEAGTNIGRLGAATAEMTHDHITSNGAESRSLPQNDFQQQTSLHGRGRLPQSRVPASKRSIQAEPDQLGEQTTDVLNSLRRAVNNIDDFKLQMSVSVPFESRQYTLSSRAKEEIDQMAGTVKKTERIFLAVQVYSDATGTKNSDAELSSKRGEAIVRYLVSKHEIPIYRIHMIDSHEGEPAQESRVHSVQRPDGAIRIMAFSPPSDTAANAPVRATNAK
jgi:outer membrane protein OmpA-like peptidoglycan-associated protein